VVVGREAELVGLELLLCDQGARLVTIVGPPGVGKSSLAYAAARRLRYRFLHGVVAIECAQLDDPRLALMRLAQLLDIAERPGAALDCTLLEELSQLEILLLLDNCEHLPALADAAHWLLAACPGLAILATSRTPLSLLAEQRLHLTPLGLPDPNTSLEQIGDAAAMQLLLTRAQRVAPGLALTPTTAPALAAICRRLDGLPLALELVAPRLSETTPAQLATQLERPLAYLDDGPRDLPPRQQTLRGALRWSVDMLGPAEQLVLARLGVFAGGWTIPALQAVCPGQADVEASLIQLQRASLIQLQQNSTAPRYTALETIRTYALEMLDATHSLAEARELHAQYYVQLLERPETVTSDLLAEYDNLRAALTWAVERDAFAQTLRLGIGLAQIWNCQRSWVQGLNWLDALFSRHMPAVQLDHALAPYPYLQCWMARHAPLLGAGSDTQICQLFAIGQALLYQALGRYAETQQLLEAALADSAPGASRFPMLILAELYTRLHQGERAHSLYQRCLAASELYGDQAGCAEALCGLARIASLRSRAEDAYRWGMRALHLYEELDQQHGVAQSLCVLGGILAQRGDSHAAIASICRSFRMCHQLRDSPGRADACEALAPILCMLGHTAQTIQLLGTAASIRQMTHTHLTSIEQVQIDIIIEYCRAQAGRVAFEQLWHETQHTTSAQQLALVERVAARRGVS
jgi:predicted ATPase